MSIEDIDEVSRWLAQFDAAVPDRYLASYMLKKMRYVPFEEVETWIQQSLLQLIDEIEKEDKCRPAIAVFPVAKPFIHKFNKDKEPKPPNDSAGRVAHSLSNLARRLPDFVEITPRINSMRARKTKHVIFVDDFIGSGNRFIDSWQNMVSPTIKSWRSFGLCKIWIISFAAHKSGLAHIINRIPAIKKDRVRINLTIDSSFIAKNSSLADLVRRYGERLEFPNAHLGYGRLLSPLVFQYGCPNNVPGIFWCGGEKGNKNWIPLFPKRSIRLELYPLFGNDLSNETTPEELWILGHHRLAIEFLNSIDRYHGEHLLLTILGYLDKQKTIEQIRNVLVLTDSEFAEKIAGLQLYGLIDDETKISRFGKDVLKRGGKSHTKPEGTNNEYTYFYPSSFLGFQRDV